MILITVFFQSGNAAHDSKMIFMCGKMDTNIKNDALTFKHARMVCDVNHGEDTFSFQLKLEFTDNNGYPNKKSITKTLFNIIL